MKILKTIAAVGALAFAGAASANTLTFQGVTFDTVASGNQLTLTVTNATSATGNWTGITYLGAFAIGEIGSPSSASLTTSFGGGSANWTVVPGGLAASGCNGAGAGFYCFDSTVNPGATLTSSFSLVINFGGTVDLSEPHLKVWFLDADGGSRGNDLLSQDIPGTSVPEPATLGLLGLGLAGVGFARRRKVAA